MKLTIAISECDLEVLKKAADLVEPNLDGSATVIVTIDDIELEGALEE